MDQQDKAGEGNSWDQRVLVIITSPILIELEPTPDLYKWIATEGQNNLYGSFGLNEDLNELFFRYVISGDNIEETCLQNALVEVVRNAIVAPEELQSKFGGTRVCEL